MIIAIDLPKKLLINNVYILEPKRNMIMEGVFSKLIYSNENFTMNGIFILFPIEVSNIEFMGNKKQIKINPYSQYNGQIIQDFSRLECRILEYYKQTKQCNRKILNSLSKQMYSGYMKIYKEYDKDQSTTYATHVTYLLKISGIWETDENIGLTYKLHEIFDNSIHQ
jgi:hypothetical protein